jgi:hypothetical protein
LVFVFLVMPGSGRLVWDGLPLSTRAEFAALIVLVLALLNKHVRTSVGEFLDQQRWRGAVKPLVGLLILAKLLTFAWFPFSDGFSACYRSLYNPLPNAEECEQSYESPFVRSGFVIDNASRTERIVDFGTHMHDWSLPPPRRGRAPRSNRLANPRRAHPACAHVVAPAARYFAMTN